MILSDSHTHLARYKPEEITGLLKQAKANNVGIAVSMGESLESSEISIRHAESNKEIFAGVGIHPWNAIMPSPEIQSALQALAKRKRVAIIGEIGLDYAKNPNNKDVQRELCAYQASLARKMGLPANIHSREAHQDMMSILRQEAPLGLKGIAHGFTGDTATVKDWLTLGFYVSIGVRGFVENEIPALVAAVKEIPDDRLLSETDMAQVGELTGPAAVSAVVKKLALVRGTTPERIAKITTANLKRLLQI